MVKCAVGEAATMEQEILYWVTGHLHPSCGAMCELVLYAVAVMAPLRIRHFVGIDAVTTRRGRNYSDLSSTPTTWLCRKSPTVANGSMRF